MRFQGKVADLTNSRTEFRFLNNSAPIVIGEGENSEQNLIILNDILDQVIQLFNY